MALMESFGQLAHARGPSCMVRSPLAPEETAGICRSGELSHMLPSEMQLIAAGWPRGDSSIGTAAACPENIQWKFANDQTMSIVKLHGHCAFGQSCHGHDVHEALCVTRQWANMRCRQMLHPAPWILHPLKQSARISECGLQHAIDKSVHRAPCTQLSLPDF